MIEYHPEKVNVVVDALSRKSKQPKGSLNTISTSLLRELKSSNAVLSANETGGLFVQFHVRPTLIDDTINIYESGKSTESIVTNVCNIL